jgi:archaellum biogenesis ATPase FlaH
MKQIELKVLKLLLNRDFYLQQGEPLSKKIFPKEVQGLIKTIAYLHKNTETDNLTVDEVYHLYESSETVTVARLELIKEILKAVDDVEALSPAVTLEVVSKVHEKEAARSIADKALAIVQRSDTALTLEALKEYVAEIDSETTADEVDTCSTDVAEIKESKKIKGVFRFTNGLEQLDKWVPALSRGHFAIIFASTNAGKSSFVAQVCVGYLQQGHKVLYFGNEDPAEDIILNLVRSVEGKTEDEVLTSSTPSWDGIRGKFTMIEAHDMEIGKIEQAVKRHKPDVVVYDQLDNVPVTGQSEKRHEALESLYQKTRQWGTKYGILNIAVSQANDEATGKLNLRSNMMANSRIGKGGTADLILGIGMKSVDNPQRSICICKNKITGRHEIEYMMLDNERCRYEE